VWSGLLEYWFQADNFLLHSYVIRMVERGQESSQGPSYMDTTPLIRPHELPKASPPNTIGS
jgi:hypothetical protein